MPRGSADGAQEYQLELYAAASPMEFLTRKRLDGECSYTWRTVLSGSHVGCKQRIERGWLSAAGGSDHWLKVVLKVAQLYSTNNTLLHFSAVAYVYTHAADTTRRSKLKEIKIPLELAGCEVLQGVRAKGSQYFYCRFLSLLHDTGTLFDTSNSSGSLGLTAAMSQNTSDAVAC